MTERGSNEDSEAMMEYSTNRSCGEVDRSDPQQSGTRPNTQLLRAQDQQHGSARDTNLEDHTIFLRNINRRSQSAREGFISNWSANSRGEARLRAKNFFARTRSLSKVADVSSWTASESHSQTNQVPLKYSSDNGVPKLSLSKSMKIHAVDDGPNIYSRGDTAEVDIPVEITTIDGGGDGGGVVDGKQGTVPEQSPIEEVALIVPTTDDPSLPIWTLRSWTLGILSCAVLSFLNTYFSFRSKPIVLGITTALIATFPLGQFMAATLPSKFVHIPWTKYGFSLNPGEFNTKEHSLIVQFASPGTLRPGGIFVITLLKIYLRGKIGFIPGFLMSLTCELLGLWWSVMISKFVVEPAKMWWPASLVNVSLIKALHTEEKEKGLSRIQFFVMCLTVAFAYHVLPGYLFPTLGGVSVLCYAFKHKTLAQQLGSGNSGLGLGAFSLDYATIASFLGSPLAVPAVAVFNIIAGVLLQAHVLVPVTYWRNYYKAKNFPLFSSSLFTAGGQRYNVTRILSTGSHSGRDFKFDPAGYDVEGPTYFSTFYTVSTGFTFMLFGCFVTQVIFFYGRDLWRILKSMFTMKQEEPDVHTYLMRKYPGIPAWWYIVMVLALHIIACVTVEVYNDQLQMRWWGVFLGDAVVAVLVLPICILMATTNQLPNLAILSQYMMGYIKPGEPVTSAVFRSYSTVICGRVGQYTTNFKFGHYMKLPPRATFLGQAIGTVVAVLVNLAVTWWLVSSVDHICDTAHLPANSPWTCPSDRIFYDQVVIWGAVGPKKLFSKGGPYSTLNYYFLPGLLLPIFLWLLQCAFPDVVWIKYINAPLIVRGAWSMPPSSVVSNTTWLTIALVFSVYVFTYKKKWWQRYNYVLSAAVEAGTVLMAVLLYYSLDEGKKRLHWWGKRENGDHCPLATCPIAIPKPGCHGY